MEKKEVEKEGLKCPRKIKLTNAEKEILHLITDEFLTIKQIAKQRDCTIQAIYKVIKSLKQKGAYDGGLNKVEKIESTFNQSDIRLHGQEFNIRILWQDSKYQELLQKSNTLFLDGNTIRLYKNSIEIYSGQSFYGKSPEEAENKSLEYWNRLLARLEHDFNVGLLKSRARNIKIVNQHFARGNSEICDNARANKERIWIYASEDGKLAYITDDSFGFREDETVHPITAKPDRKAVDKQVNDWRINDPPTNSELATNINNFVLGFDTYGKNILTHINVLNQMAQSQKAQTQAIKQLTKVMKGVLKENKKLKLGSQKELNEWGI